MFGSMEFHLVGHRKMPIARGNRTTSDDIVEDGVEARWSDGN